MAIRQMIRGQIDTRMVPAQTLEYVVVIAPEPHNLLNPRRQSLTPVRDQHGQGRWGAVIERLSQATARPPAGLT